MHIPKPAVCMKMQAEGLDPAILDMDPEKPAPGSGGGGGGGNEAPKCGHRPLNTCRKVLIYPPPLVRLKEDPQYAKFFKMLSMHIPKPAVCMKMQAEGLDPAILDMDPEKPAPGGLPRM
jgi:hypothetical protein